MAQDPDTESELKSDVRNQTGLTDTVTLSNDALDTAYRNAIRHIRVEAGLSTTVDWFDEDHPEREDALFWWTCLFALVAAGRLEQQALSVAAVDVEVLLAKDNNQITTWYRNAQNALNAVSSSSGGNTGFVSTAPERENRVYGEDDDTSSGLTADDL